MKLTSALLIAIAAFVVNPCTGSLAHAQAGGYLGRMLASRFATEDTDFQTLFRAPNQSQGHVDLVIELLDDLRRGVLRYAKPLPGARLEADMGGLLISSHPVLTLTGVIIWGSVTTLMIQFPDF
jgi:hypothetical protein